VVMEMVLVEVLVRGLLLAPDCHCFQNYHDFRDYAGRALGLLDVQVLEMVLARSLGLERILIFVLVRD
jgi:hypothetical protein